MATFSHSSRLLCVFGKEIDTMLYLSLFCMRGTPFGARPPCAWTLTTNKLSLLLVTDCREQETYKNSS
ncbi:hypothetical protein KSB_19490 [Ktedonobacter robiniae]|uniref:Uncharacterized protein n=1 Tax=Ktedonobacter robiniae TaxID=2778365 RepID=A0ABQ3UL81_9CHLR|nr:hypothetical protein KSB_19490 [Ktedonobacter robiniae]